MGEMQVLKFGLFAVTRSSVTFHFKNQSIPLEMLLQLSFLGGFLQLPSVKFEQLLSITRQGEGKRDCSGVGRKGGDRAKEMASYIFCTFLTNGTGFKTEVIPM